MGILEFAGGVVETKIEIMTMFAKTVLFGLVPQ